MPGIGVHP